jgi:hypothetical protein
MEIYVKPNTNCEGLSLIRFPERGETQTIKKVFFHDKGKRKAFFVYGHSSLFFHSLVPARCTPTEMQGQRGFVVHGADFGLVFSRTPLTAYAPELPGRPIVWIAEEDRNDIVFAEEEPHNDPI